MSDKKLTDKQTLFIHEYLSNGFNATQAAKSAGYSEDTAQQIGAENLSKPFIRSEIDKALDIVLSAKKELMTQVLDGFESIAFDDNGIHKTQDQLRAMEGLARYLGMSRETKVLENDKITELIDEMRKIK